MNLNGEINNLSNVSATIAATTKTKRAKKAVDLKQLARNYKKTLAVDLDSRTARIAHALDYMANNAPYIPVPDNILAMMVLGYAHMPRHGTDEVKAVWGGLSAARKLLEKEYGRTCWTVKGEGVMAAVNDDHAATQGLPRAAKRLVSAEKNVQDVRATIDINKITSKSAISYVRGVDKSLKLIGTGDLMKRLLVEKTP